MKTTKRLDRETKGSYTCIVTAIDAGSTPRSSNVNININILDENDNTPAVGSSYRFEITEEQDSNLTIGRIVASDKDIGENGRLSYTLEADSVTLR